MAIPLALPILEIVESTIGGSSVADVVKREFDLCTIEECSFLVGGFNDNYELRLANGERFIARLSKRRPRGGPNIPFELSLLEHLKREGIAVATARRTRQGNWSVPLSTPEGSRDLVLFDYLDGKRPGDDLDAIRLTGHGLARIHASAHRYLGPASAYRLDMAYLLWKPLERIDSLRHIDAELKARFHRLATDTYQRLSGLVLTEVLCHGDCHGSNNFIGLDVTGTHVAQFFDFDDSGPGYVAYDLAVFLWARLFRGGQAELTGTIKAAWNAFIEGYRSHTEISDDDLGAVACFVSIRMMWYVGEYAGNIHKLGTGNITAAWFGRMADQLEKWRYLDATI